VRDPTEEDPSHAMICPPTGITKNNRKSDARKMTGEAKWLAFPASHRA
jgi:hypothetical protein